MLLLDAIDLATGRIILKDNIKVIYNNIITFLQHYKADYQENLFSRVTFWPLMAIALPVKRRRASVLDSANPVSISTSIIELLPPARIARLP